MKYRVEIIEKLMQNHDDTELPHLFNTSVFYKLPKKKSYFDKEPIKALKMIKLDPFLRILFIILA